MSGAVNRKQLKQSIIQFMRSRNLHDDNLIKEIPNSWEKYGDLILFSNNSFVASNWMLAGDSLWELICNLLKCKRVALKGNITNDDFRSPKIKLMYGKPGEVYFTDNGIIYTWDMEHSMFCRGNACERHRIAKLDCTNEVIVDLFAGIGYFTLPYLVKANAKQVHACEWNPYAVKALRRNLELNKVSNKCIIHEGDNRKFAPKNVGNRINIGIIPDSQNFWRTSCESLISEGGILYIHQNITSNISNNVQTCSICSKLLSTNNIDRNHSVKFNGETLINSISFMDWKMVEWFDFSIHILHVICSYLKEIYNKQWCISINNYYRIKSYAPHIDHLVYEVLCSPL